MIGMRVLLAFSFALVGCIDTSNVDTNTQSLGVGDAVTYNRLAGNRLAGNRLAGNRLAGNRLAGNRLQLESSAQDLLDTADGRDVLTYIISCAEPAGVVLVGTASDGTSYEFDGEIGLAPQWENKKLDPSGGRWVSACLFARVNLFDVAVPISMRGPNPALTVSPDEVANWTLQEGAFYGDFFVPLNQPIQWIACRGHDDTTAQNRVCTQPDPANPSLTMCTFAEAGTCYRSAHRAHGACHSFSANGYYTDCGIHGHAAADTDEHHGDGDDDVHPAQYDEVITTYVHP
jgi:hypothetical protein